MLTAVGDFAVFQDWSDRDHPIFLKIDRNGSRERLDFASAHCRVHVTREYFVLDYGDKGLARVDPVHNFAVAEFRLCDGGIESQAWTLATLSNLIDEKGLWYRRYAYDSDALKLPDPGYSYPVDCQLIPGGEEVAIFIMRCNHFALFNLRTGATKLLPLPSYGSGNCALENGKLWFTNYDIFCHYDPTTEKFAVSARLQAPFRSSKHGFSNGFVGVPEFVPWLNGWLIPRPYTGDILFVRSDTLAGQAHIACGGRPYEAALLSDGSILVTDHPSDDLRVMHLDDLVPL